VSAIGWDKLFSTIEEPTRSKIVDEIVLYYRDKQESEKAVQQLSSLRIQASGPVQDHDYYIQITGTDTYEIKYNPNGLSNRAMLHTDNWELEGKMPEYKEDCDLDQFSAQFLRNWLTICWKRNKYPCEALMKACIPVIDSSHILDSSEKRLFMIEKIKREVGYDAMISEKEKTRVNFPLFK